MKIKGAADGYKIKSCLSLKGAFFLSVAGDPVVFSYGFKMSFDFFASFFYQEKNEENKYIPLNNILSFPTMKRKKQRKITAGCPITKKQFISTKEK